MKIITTIIIIIIWILNWTEFKIKRSWEVVTMRIILIYKKIILILGVVIIIIILIKELISNILV